MPFKFTYTVSVSVKSLHDCDGSASEDYPKAPITREAAERVIKQHIDEAVATWGGQYHPNDLLFPTNITNVTVKSVKKK